MAAKLTPIGWISKFLVVPAALAALGFYIIGPRVGAGHQASRQTGTNDDAAGATPGVGSAADAPEHPDIRKLPYNGSSVVHKNLNGQGPNLGQDGDLTPSVDQGQEDSPKPRTRPRTKPIPNLVAPPTDPTPDDPAGAGGKGSNGG